MIPNSRIAHPDDAAHRVFHPECPLCNAPGRLLYCAVQDRLYNAPGKWNYVQCSDPKCGLIWINPIPEKEDMALAYESYYTHTRNHQPAKDTWRQRLLYSAGLGYLALRYRYPLSRRWSWRNWLGVIVFFNCGLRAKLDFSVCYLAADPGKRLLDIGCGSGKMLRRMQELGWEVEGIDTDRTAVAMASEAGLNVRCGELADQDFADSYFDVVVMSHTIEHISDSCDVLGECHRILRPGGKMIIITPNSKGLGHILFRKWWFHLDPPRHLRIFTPPTIDRLARQAGFQERRIFTTVRDAHGVFLASWSIIRSGRYLMGSPQSLFRRLSARGMQLIEWLILQIFPHAGEEIVMVAVK